MILPFLRPGDTIGLCSPSHVVDSGNLDEVVFLLRSFGFKVKVGNNILRDDWMYCATKEQRADDFNQLVRDKDVQLVFFGGGESSPELLPLLDFQAIAKYPKLYCSFSDGTTILEAIHAQTGLPVFYGPTPNTLLEDDPYTLSQFDTLTVEHAPYRPSSPWTVLSSGMAKGELVGGYLRNFALMLGNKYFSYKQKPYILFLEDHESFTEVGGVAEYLEYIAQNPFAEHVRALLFGHYSEGEDPALLGILDRFAKRFSIPCAYCHDFGHGKHHAIIPIGIEGAIDMEKNRIDWKF